MSSRQGGRIYLSTSSHFFLVYGLLGPLGGGGIGGRSSIPRGSKPILCGIGPLMPGGGIPMGGGPIIPRGIMAHGGRSNGLFIIIPCGGPWGGGLCISFIMFPPGFMGGGTGGGRCCTSLLDDMADIPSIVDCMDDGGGGGKPGGGMFGGGNPMGGIDCIACCDIGGGPPMKFGGKGGGGMRC